MMPENTTSYSLRERSQILRGITSNLEHLGGNVRHLVSQTCLGHGCRLKIVMVISLFTGAQVLFKTFTIMLWAQLSVITGPVVKVPVK